MPYTIIIAVVETVLCIAVRKAPFPLPDCMNLIIGLSNLVIVLVSPPTIDITIRPVRLLRCLVCIRSCILGHRPGDIQHQHNIQRCGLASLGHLVGDIGLQGQGIISVLIIVDRLVHHDAVVALCVDPVAPVAAARVFCRQGSSGNHCQHHTEDQKC